MGVENNNNTALVPNEDNVKQLSDFFISNCEIFTEEEIQDQIKKLEGSGKLSILDQIKIVFKNKLELKDITDQVNRINEVQNNLDLLKAMYISNANSECSLLKKEITQPVEDKKKLENQ